jgi:predicted GIY-YIG superfamily endonuclease
MIKEQPKEWNDLLIEAQRRLSENPQLRFSKMTPSLLPEIAGVYLITKIEDEGEVPYYIGRTKNLRQRLYTQHLMGSLANAQLKKYLIDNKICSTIKDAKEFIKSYCAARWLEENDYRVRGAIEGYCTAMLFPAYGIDEEH